MRVETIIICCAMTYGCGGSSEAVSPKENKPAVNRDFVIQQEKITQPVVVFQSNRFDYQLADVLTLVLATKTGAALKPHIDELIQMDKLKLSDLHPGHYGESGEGCVVKEGRYFYEGLYVLLNKKQTLEELASSLVHEVTHYQMIKELVGFNFEFPVKVAAFEISAFATQYEFIAELESLNLADRSMMFKDDGRHVAEIMDSAFQLRENWSDEGYEAVFKQLVNFGYPQTELNRTISQRSQKQCAGPTKQASHVYPGG